MMLWMPREVAWLSEGSCTDHVISAAAIRPDNPTRPRPNNSRRRRAKASRIEVGRWPTRGMTRSIAGMSFRPPRLSERLDQAMQRLGRRFAVRNQRKADIAPAGIEAVGLLPREIAAGNDPHTGLAIELHRHRLVAAKTGHVEPDTEAAVGPLVAVAAAEDLVGEIELDAIEPAVLLDMRLVAIGRDRDMLQRHRHLRRRDVAQLEEQAEEPSVAGGKADAHARQIRALRQRLEGDHAGEIIARMFQRTAGRFAGVDFRIAFVAQDDEAVAVGE